MYLEHLDLRYKEQIFITGPNGYPCFYDFEINDTTIIEIDGKQHFKMIPYFHKIEENFLKSRERDIYKHHLALKNGKKVIRINYTKSSEKIAEHINRGLACEEKEYFSNPSMYEWLREGVKELRLKINIIFDNIYQKSLIFVTHWVTVIKNIHVNKSAIY